MKESALITFEFQGQEKQGILLAETNAVYNISGYLYTKDEVKILAVEQADPIADFVAKAEGRILGLEARLQRLAKLQEDTNLLLEQLAKLTTNLSETLVKILNPSVQPPSQ